MVSHSVGRRPAITSSSSSSFGRVASARDFQAFPIGKGERRSRECAFIFKIQLLQNGKSQIACRRDLAFPLQRADDHVVQHAQARKGLDDLEGPADARCADLMWLQILNRQILKMHRPRVGRKHARDHVEAGRLAGAIRADQRHDGALGNLEGRAGDGLQSAE
jgi:hypothetical protein